MKNKNTIRKIESVIELAIMAVAYYFVWKYMIFDREYFFPFLGRGKYVLMGIYFILMLVIIHLCEGFKYGILKIADVLFSQWIAIFIVNAVTYLQLCLMANIMIPVKPMLLLTVGDFLLSGISVYIFFAIYERHSKASKLLMVYGNKESVGLKLKMDTRADSYNIKNIVSIDEGIDKICQMLADYDGIVISDVSAEQRNDLLKYCYMHEIETYITPKISDVIISGGEGIHQFDTPLVMINTTGLTPEQEIVKRIFDVILCVIAAVVLSPLMLIVALAIKLEDHGPVFYKQARVTKDGKVFDILKFRSMVEDAEQRPATDDDDRITKVGHVIRATRIDELPQIFNIIKGDMSIVGPRPERTEHVEKYTAAIPEFEFRNKVKGGLTGYAQIYGKYNTSAYDKIKLDLMYIENYSFLLDLKLILMTIRIVFKKESTEGFDKVVSADEILDEINRN
ncbi:exopolysaccharide biosynthesis polyprenyl glycosylphosphotransferase [Pseudobutyrivibrio sp. C4]|uniref:sugar transferase n=1 Tax=unclassified Pseudobutyrivibrio TaxID=2638619 RepID=UPI0008CA911A|nr:MULTISPECIES: sugar transferase [unclassified Pseudobutyrivibrio]SET26279.1 exopolysaccharide biosynthesis polyprenyl glycosylphosphotransferase [Pseudobutyrivibrio sp. C4]SFO35909.1 exopolysaccharide biosynthesis polyprenyl glycosylphosphotransferase [Pseudobutyrivibrio sp. JW11]